MIDWKRKGLCDRETVGVNYHYGRRRIANYQNLHCQSIGRCCRGDEPVGHLDETQRRGVRWCRSVKNGYSLEAAHGHESLIDRDAIDRGWNNGTYRPRSYLR